MEIENQATGEMEELDENSLPIIVCAGNYDQYQMYLASHGLHSGNAIYADSNHLYGVRAKEMIIIGTFWEKKDSGKIFELAESRIVK